MRKSSSSLELPRLEHGTTILGFPGGSDGKEPACNAGDLGLFPGLARSPGQGNGYPLQYSCLENSMDRGAWLGYKELDTTERVLFFLNITIPSSFFFFSEKRKIQGNFYVK